METEKNPCLCTKPDFDTKKTTLVLSDNDDFEHSYEALILRDVEKHFRKESLTDYKDEDVSRICNWFSNIQHRFGAPEVFRQGVQNYAKTLINLHS